MTYRSRVLDVFFSASGCNNQLQNSNVEKKMFNIKSRLFWGLTVTKKAYSVVPNSFSGIAFYHIRQSQFVVRVPLKEKCILVLSCSTAWRLL